MTGWLPDSMAGASDAGQVFAALLVGIVLTMLFRYILGIFGLGR